jgi:hypothetical protein
MRMDRVKFDGKECYVENIRLTGRQKGQKVKTFGKIIKCSVCGEDTFVTNRAINKGNGRVCSLKCKSTMENNGHWKGGKVDNGRGYIMIRLPNHPKANRGYVLEHRIVIEQKEKRILGESEVVHHINGDKRDNRAENLLVLTPSEHARKHRKMGSKVFESLS